MTLYLLKVHLQTFLSIPITQKCQILSCDTLVANERYVSRGCHVLLHSTERNTLKIDSFFGMSLPSQNCSTGLPIKYCRCHAHLSSSTDHHGNDSLAIRGGGGGGGGREKIHRQDVQEIPGKSVNWLERPQEGTHNNYVTSTLHLIIQDVKTRRKSNRGQFSWSVEIN